MYRGTPNSDPEKIKTALWNLIKNADDEITANVFVTNRPVASNLTDFAVVDINGVVVDYDGYSRCVCMVQLFAKDIDTKGTSNMAKLSQMYDNLLKVLPYNVAPYTFDKKNQVGRRDIHGFHATMVNLDCLIY